MKVFILLTTLFIATAASASPEKAVQRFVAAGDAQDIKSMERVLHEDFVTRFSVGESGKPITMKRSAYLSGLAAKKFGGDTRQVQLESVHHLGKFSLALVRIKGKKGSFRSAYTLMKVGSTWKIVTDMSVFTPAKS